MCVVCWSSSPSIIGSGGTRRHRTTEREGSTSRPVIAGGMEGEYGNPFSVRRFSCKPIVDR